MADDDKERPVFMNPDDARQGVTGHNVRYVLAFSLLFICIAFGLLVFAAG